MGGNPRGSQESNAVLTMNYLNSAFTLIDLLVVLAVIGIPVAMGSAVSHQATLTIDGATGATTVFRP